MINSPMINLPVESRPRYLDRLTAPPTDPGDGPAETRLRLTEAVPLIHALIADIATRAGIAALAIKGPVLASYGLRDPRPSADADIMVAPTRLAELVERLADYGWHERYERPIARILNDHSVTLTHPEWPCDADLHWYFPGLFADPDDTFSFLWSGREIIELAHRPVPAAGRIDAAAISALHALRHPDSARHQADLGNLAARLASCWQQADGLRLVELADRCGATVTLAPFLTAFGLNPRSGVGSPLQLAAWRAYTGTHDQGSTGAWLYALERARWRERPGLVIRALYPTRRELIAEHGPLSRRDRWSLRAHRWLRAGRALPHAVGVLRRTAQR